MLKIAIVGAGLSGLALARQLAPLARVEVFEKSRGYGGRMATRSRDGFVFDHGAQFFTARTPAFVDFLQPFIDDGVVARWDARFVELEGNRVTAQRQWGEQPAHYVAVPGMNALGKALAAPLDVRRETRVGRLERIPVGWRLWDSAEQPLGEYDWVVLAMPAAQAIALLPDDFPARDSIVATPMLACYSLMLGFDQPLALPWDAALVTRADISWVSVNSSKPGRRGGYALLVHSTNRWAEQNLQLERAQALQHLMDQTSAVLETDLGGAVHVDLHRWLYANVARQTGSKCHLDPALNLALVGDWCIHGRIEAAYLSAREAATQLQPILT